MRYEAVSSWYLVQSGWASSKLLDRRSFQSWRYFPPLWSPLVAWIEINCQCGGTEGILCNVWWILMPTAVYWSTQLNRVSKYFSDVESTMSREKWISWINCRHQQPALQRFCELTDVLSSLKHGIALFAGLSVSSTPPYIVSRCFTHPALC